MIICVRRDLQHNISYNHSITMNRLSNELHMGVKLIFNIHVHAQCHTCVYMHVHVLYSCVLIPVRLV